ncbi:universal stress protein [Pseudonocardia sp. H11422]|uniref:universal stress protein n=1 Tax=Pseudonocardia sp. H11422 TaxID=2835866 RepID=UPI001BDD2611|nr:universal stress protein [Pseudonocardia sp. H11422]
MNAAMIRGPVVVGIDGSEPSMGALAWARDEARRRGRPLTVVHAYGGDRGAAQKVLDGAVAQAREGADSIEIRSLLEPGSPASVLLKEAVRAEMIVLGFRGHGGFTGMLLGSTPLQVAHHAGCPVVVIREGARDVAPGPSAGRVVLGLDGSPQSERAAALAFEEARYRGVGLTAVRAWLVPDIDTSASPAHEWEQAESDEQRKLAESLAGWQDVFPGVDVIAKTVGGDPAPILIDESAGAELLVAGSHGRGGFGGLMLGSVSHALLHHAHCPVAVARA